MKQVFVAHSIADQHLSEAVVSALEGAGLGVFSADKIAAGVDWASQIREQIQDASCLIAVSSGGAAPNANIAFEIGLATALKKPVYLISSSDNDSFTNSWVSANVRKFSADNFTVNARKIAAELAEPIEID